MVDTRSNIQLTDLNAKPHGDPILRDFIDCAIYARFYPPPAPTITHFLASISFMYPLTVQLINSVRQTDINESVPFALPRLRGNKYHVAMTTYNQIHEKQPRVPKFSSYYYVKSN